MYRIEVPGFDLYKSYMADPFLRWTQLSERRFVVTCGQHAVVAEQQGEALTLWCDDKAFYNFWYYYFDLSRDYLAVEAALRHVTSIKPQLRRARGVHMMGSNVYETTLACAVAYGTFNPKGTLDRFARQYGKERHTSIREIGKAAWHQLPTPKVATKQEGHTPRVYALCEMFIENRLSEDVLYGLTPDEVTTECAVRGIGKNIAAMVCNASLQHIEVYPHSKFHDQVFEQVMGITIEELLEWEPEVAPYAGYLHRVAMYNYYEPPEEVLYDGFA